MNKNIEVVLDLMPLITLYYMWTSGHTSLVYVFGVGSQASVIASAERYVADMNYAMK